MSYRDKLIKSEWAWVHSTARYNDSEDSILTKAKGWCGRDPNPGAELPPPPWQECADWEYDKHTRTTRKRLAWREGMHNVLKAEERADKLVRCFRRIIEHRVAERRYPSILNYREVCAELLGSNDKTQYT